MNIKPYINLIELSLNPSTLDSTDCNPISYHSVTIQENIIIFKCFLIYKIFLVMSKILDLHIFAGWVGAVTTRHAEARGDISFLFWKFVNFVSFLVVYTPIGTS